MRTAASWLALGAVLAGCSDESYALVSVLSQSGRIDDVTQLRVHVSSEGAEEVLAFPREPSAQLELDPEDALSFSVEFDASHSRQVTFEIEALDGAQGVRGYGQSRADVLRAKVTPVTVLVVPGAVRPERTLDGGVSDAPSLSCTPYAPLAACGPNQTCGLFCEANRPAMGMCYVAGPGAPGTACASNTDCEPGSQCFALSAAGCSVKACLRFCDSDDSACGHGAYCNVPIRCGATPSFLACSQACDPTGATSGCATGLACFVYAGETTDCACAGLGGIGDPCTQNAGCAGGATDCAGCRAGLSCVLPSTSPGLTAGTCRPVCGLATPSCPTGTACHPFESSTRRLYGFCQ